MVRTGDYRCICISSDIDDTILIFLMDLVKGVREERKIFYELGFFASSGKVDSDVNTDLMTRLVEDKDQDSTGNRFNDCHK